jgi:hypothetical protein
VFKTINLILGMPALNQYDAAATDLRDMFDPTPDLGGYCAGVIFEAPDGRLRDR